MPPEKYQEASIYFVQFQNTKITQKANTWKTECDITIESKIIK